MLLFDQVRSFGSRAVRAVRAVRDAGVLRPMRPDRALRVPLAYLRFGPVPATVGAMSALRFPDRTALIDERGALTYGELDERAASLATALRERIGDGKVGILCRNHRGFVEALLAASRTGNDVVLLNTDFSSTQLGQVAEREEIALLVHDAEFSESVHESGFTGRQLIAWPTPEEAYETETIDELVSATTPEPIRPETTSGVVVMTSGTTGTPKGARHDVSLSSVLPVAISHLMRVPVRSGTPMVIAPPLFHILGFAYMTVGLGMGMPLVLSSRFDADETLQAITNHEAGALVAVPTMLQQILTAKTSTGTTTKAPSTPSLRVVLCGGSPLHPHLSDAFMDVFGDVLINLYGATETGWATIATPADLRAAPGTVGRPSLRITIRVLGEDGSDVPTGETGEIYTGGGLRFAGYTGGGGKNEMDGLTSTGDLGHFDDAGRLFIDGRADDMIVSGGENVFPGEVEDLIGGHPDVADVSVTGVDDDKFGQRLAAHVVRTPAAEITEDDIKAYVKKNLARYKVPRDVHFTDELPRTSTGKVKQNRLND